MTRKILAGFVGAAVAAALVAWPLLKQRQRMEEIVLKSTRASGMVPGRTAGETLSRWSRVRGQGSKAEADLRAAESVQSLTAAECRAAAGAALASGDKSPLPDLLGRWTALDGKGAFAWLGEHPDLLELVLEDAGPAWAASDPTGYAAWLPTYRSDSNFKKVLPELGGDFETFRTAKWLAPYDLPAAIRIPIEKIRSAGIDQLSISKLQLAPFIVSVKDAEALGAEISAHPEWLDNIPSEKPLRVLVALRECWQDLDPDGWDRWAEAHPDMAAKADNQPVRPGLVFLRSKDPRAAADQILAATPLEKQGETVDGLVHLWVETDLNAAGTWLNQRPEGPDKWEAMQTFALAAVKEDPAAALTWATSIPDPTQQARAQRRVLAQWADTDPAAAAAWLPQSGWGGPQLQNARDILSIAHPAKPQ